MSSLRNYATSNLANTAELKILSYQDFNKSDQIRRCYLTFNNDSIPFYKYESLLAARTVKAVHTRVKSNKILEYQMNRNFSQ